MATASATDFDLSTVQSIDDIPADYLKARLKYLEDRGELNLQSDQQGAQLDNLVNNWDKIQEQKRKSKPGFLTNLFKYASFAIPIGLMAGLALPGIFDSLSMETPGVVSSLSNFVQSPGLTGYQLYYEGLIGSLIGMFGSQIAVGIKQNKRVSLENMQLQILNKLKVDLDYNENHNDDLKKQYLISQIMKTDHDEKDKEFLIKEANAYYQNKSQASNLIGKIASAIIRGALIAGLMYFFLPVLGVTSVALPMTLSVVLGPLMALASFQMASSKDNSYKAFFKDLLGDTFKEDFTIDEKSQQKLNDDVSLKKYEMHVNKMEDGEEKKNLQNHINAIKQDSGIMGFMARYINPITITYLGYCGVDAIAGWVSDYSLPGIIEDTSIMGVGILAALSTGLGLFINRQTSQSVQLSRDYLKENIGDVSGSTSTQSPDTSADDQAAREAAELERRKNQLCVSIEDEISYRRDDLMKIIVGSAADGTDGEFNNDGMYFEEDAITGIKDKRSRNTALKKGDISGIIAQQIGHAIEDAHPPDAAFIRNYLAIRQNVAQGNAAEGTITTSSADGEIDAAAIISAGHGKNENLPSLIGRMRSQGLIKGDPLQYARAPYETYTEDIARLYLSVEIISEAINEKWQEKVESGEISVDVDQGELKTQLQSGIYKCSLVLYEHMLRENIDIREKDNGQDTQAARSADDILEDVRDKVNSIVEDNFQASFAPA